MPRSSCVVIAKTPNKKVQIITDENRLRLRWSFASGKRTSMNLSGLYRGNPNDLAAAKELAEVIEVDLLTNKYDVSKKKYKLLLGKPLPDEVGIEENASESPYAQVVLLHANYKLKTKQITEATHKKYYQKICRWLNTYCIGLNEIEIYNLILETKPPYTGKFFLEYIQAALSWGLIQKKVTENPFASLEYPKSRLKKLNKITKKDCFTREERAKIIQAFEEDDYFYCYADFVKFLFFTGCRPSEAAALTRDKITSEGILFDVSVSDTFEGLRITKDTKTETSRFFPMNSQLREVVEVAKSKSDPKPGRNLLFPPPRNGKFITINNFRKRAWYPMLEKAAVAKRVPYTTRHTFITMCLEAEMNIGVLAYRCGTSRQIIETRYANFSKSQVETPLI